jgi:replicative DNA helicase
MEERAYSISSSDAATEVLKVPPQSIEAEQSVLGGLMLDNQSWDRIADRLGPNDFYRKEHRLIFRAVAALCDDNQPADVVTVSEWLESNGELGNAGGLAYLGALANNTPSAANILAYADIVHERAVLRNLIRVTTQIGHSAYSPEGRSAGELLDLAEKSIMDISEQGAHRRGGFHPLKTLLTAAVDRIDTLFRSESAITGVPTGFSDLDAMTSGLQAGDLVIVAGRPSMGKTSFAMNVAENAAVGQKQARRRRLAATDLGDRSAGRRADLHRRHAGPDAARAALALAAPEARARARHDRGRLPAAHAVAGIEREPRHRDLRHHALAQGPGQGAQRTADRHVAAQPQSGAAPQQAPGDVRPARVRDR